MLMWIVPLFFGLSLGGLAYILMQALSSGAEVYAGTYSERTAREFEDVFLFVPPRRIAEAGWAAGGFFFVVFFLLTGSFTSVKGALMGLICGGLFGGLALCAPKWILVVLKMRRLRRFNEQLVDTLISMSNALKAGFSIMQAFESVVKEGQNPIAQEFEVFLQETRVGVTFTDALMNLERRVGSEDMTLVAMAIETARKTGGNLTEILEKISATIRERMRIENRIRTLTAQGRLQGIVVGAMPIVVGVALTAIDPGLMMPFFHSVAGILTVVAVVFLLLGGMHFIRKIVSIDI